MLRRVCWRWRPLATGHHSTLMLCSFTNKVLAQHVLFRHWKETKACKADAVSETDVFVSSTGNFNITALDHMKNLRSCPPSFAVRIRVVTSSCSKGTGEHTTDTTVQKKFRRCSSLSRTPRTCLLRCNDRCQGITKYREPARSHRSNTSIGLFHSGNLSWTDLLRRKSMANFRVTPTTNSVKGTMEVPQSQYIDRIVDVTVCCNTKYDPSEQCTSRQHRRQWRLIQRQSSMIQKDGRALPSAVH